MFSEALLNRCAVSHGRQRQAARTSTSVNRNFTLSLWPLARSSQRGRVAWCGSSTSPLRSGCHWRGHLHKGQSAGSGAPACASCGMVDVPRDYPPNTGCGPQSAVTHTHW